MAFIAIPDVASQVVTQEQVIVAKPPSSSGVKIRKKAFGICELFYATEDEISENDDSSVNSLHPATYMDDFLPAEMQNLLYSRGSGGIDWEWYGEWSESFTVTVFKQPSHGKFVNLRNDPKLLDLQYLPDRGYFGKDRVDVLVEGKDERDRPIALTIEYYINILPEKELYKIGGKGKSSIVKTYKKLCGVDKGVWDISHNHQAPSAKK